MKTRVIRGNAAAYRRAPPCKPPRHLLPRCAENAIANTRSVPDVTAAGGASGVSASSTLDATIDVFWASVPFSLQSEGAESGLSPGSALFHQAAQFLYYRPANGDKRAKCKSGAAGTAAVVALRRQPSIILLISRVRRRYGHQDERNQHRCVRDVSARVLLHGEPHVPRLSVLAS